ncbi:MAG TPA: hypothetical protein DCQ92_02670 [Verrucomicrobia subdivision 3 bacterium]|nr:hypothetical protein [Limisphaerales bacterium]
MGGADVRLVLMLVPMMMSEGTTTGGSGLTTGAGVTITGTTTGGGLTGSGGNSGTFKRFGGSVTAQAMNLPSCARRTTMNGWRNFFCPAADSLKIFRTPSSNGVPEIPV